MIQFYNTVTSYEFIMTLTELVTINEPIYVFVFTHVLTKDQVSFSRSQENDNSDFPERYNSFTIDTTQFEHIGEWHYVVTEEQTGNILEQGKMIITRDSFNYAMYGGITTYTAYNG